MAVRKFNPVTPSSRQLCITDKFHVWNGKAVFSLRVGRAEKAGRNHHGHITTRHQGGRNKRIYRTIEFPATQDVKMVTRIEYDPNRSAFVALLHSQSGQTLYMLAPRGIRVGDVIHTGNPLNLKAGNVLTLSLITPGSILHNLEIFPGKGPQMIRSAGCFGQLVTRLEKYSIVKLPSGERRYFVNSCRASLGSVSKSDWNETVLGKAGRSRWLGIRPSVRGVAMNPIDHPHGGGEGKTASGRPPVSPWGKLTKGMKTRRVRKSSHHIFKFRYER